jgi:AcrR family transcriptional regulator
MRVTAKVKEQTRDRILRAARKLFVSKGFDETTTRDIAARAGIAVGTLFNYFPSKEALGMAMVVEALESAAEEFQARRRGGETLDELLFGYVFSGLRALAPQRAFVGAVLESALSPFAVGSNGGGAGDAVRANHLEAVAELIAEHSPAPTLSFVVMHLYWTLYLGVLAFWSGDDSPNQEDTLAVVDQSLRLFVKSLATNSAVDGSPMSAGQPSATLDGPGPVRVELKEVSDGA